VIKGFLSRFLDQTSLSVSQSFLTNQKVRGLGFLEASLSFRFSDVSQTGKFPHLSMSQQSVFPRLLFWEPQQNGWYSRSNVRTSSSLPSTYTPTCRIRDCHPTEIFNGKTKKKEGVPTLMLLFLQRVSFLSSHFSLSAPSKEPVVTISIKHCKSRAFKRLIISYARLLRR
jgi:hypothetical protein